MSRYRPVANCRGLARQPLLVALVAALAVGCCALKGQAANFTPASGDWDVGGNWSSGDYPGSVTATDNAATISSSTDKTANLDAALAQDLTGVRLDGQGVGFTSTLNILPGAAIVVENGTTNAQIQINEAGGGDGDATVNQTGGDLSFNQLRIGRDGGTSTFSISGGNATYDGTGGGNTITMRGDSGVATSIIDVSGTGNFQQTGTSNTHMGSADSQILVSGSGTLDLTGGGSLFMATTNRAGDTSLLEVTGSLATVDLNNLDAEPVNAGSTATLGYVLDGSGVSPIGVVGSVTLGTGSVLDIDFTAISDAFTVGDIVLIDNANADAISGTFPGRPEGSGVMNFGGSAYQLTYIYDSATGTLTGNDLALIAVPEPSALLLVLLGLCGLARRRCRR